MSLIHGFRSLFHIDDAASPAATTKISLSALVPAQDVLALTHDEYFPNENHNMHHHSHHNSNDPSTASQQHQQQPSASVRKIAKDLDISRITPRLLACGQMWKQRNERLSNRNNIDDIARFLHHRYPNRFMIWNLSCMYRIIRIIMF